MNISRDDAATRIELFANEGRLIQASWHSQAADGRELACLLGAIDPSVTSPETCPATIMPPWMAHLLPTLFDGVAPDKAIGLGLRFAGALRTGRTDDGVRNRWLACAVEDAVKSATPTGNLPPYWEPVRAACERVVTLLRKGGSKADFEAAAARAGAAEAAAEAEAAARAAAQAAAWAAARAAWAEAAWAGAAAAWAAAAQAAAWAAARAAWAAQAAAAWAATARAAGAAWAAQAEAYERLFDALITEMMA